LVDAGALVAAGGNSGTTKLLSMAKTDVLRIYVDVPQSDYRQIKNGASADVLLQEFPGQTFAAKVTNIAGSLNSDTRTLRTEIRIDNHAHTLTPGSFAQVRFAYNNPTPPVVVPSNATVTKNDGLYVPVVANGRVHYHPVTVARDYGNKIEISTGLHANDVVLLDAPDSLSDGAQVKPLMQQVASAK
jgi:RND family efflux transporter MFP subunit